MNVIFFEYSLPNLPKTSSSDNEFEFKGRSSNYYSIYMLQYFSFLHSMTQPNPLLDIFLPFY